MNNVYEFDVVIVGAGVIGLSIAWELSNVYDNVLLIEKEESFGHHISSHNSEIIHSGIYYPKEALKTKLCVEGNKLLYQFLDKYNLPHKRCGKFIVATRDAEERVLEQLYKQGIENNIGTLEFLDKQEVNAIEPALKCTSALHVHSTGIVDTHSVMRMLEYLSQENGVIVLYNTELSKINTKNNVYEMTTKNDDVLIQAKVVVNSAGLWSDQVAKMVGIDNYELKWSKGEYYRTSKYKNMKKLVYPVPDPEGKYLGIHTVLDLDGGLSFGPNAYYVDDLNYNMTSNNKAQFHEAINRYLDISWDDLHPAMTGIRPKLQAQSDLFKDFVIENNSEYKNFINLIGIESPGLTSCLAIAKYVREIIE